MDWTLAIERNLAALRRIAATLFAMAAGADAAPGAIPAPATLPRHLHAAMLAILRPAESALRRLIVIAARNVVVTLPPAERAHLAQAALPAQISRTGIFLNGRPVHPDDLARLHPPHGMAAIVAPGGDAQARSPCFSLFDPLKRFGPVRQGPSRTTPRILFNLDAPPALPERRIVSPDDPVGAALLRRRLAALQHALDDLPGQAQRLARWRARRSIRARGRLSPLRPGSPPGHRQRSSHPVDDVLHRCHGLAIDIAMRRDTS